MFRKYILRSITVIAPEVSSAIKNRECLPLIRSYLRYLIAATVLFACDQVVYFEEPQPAQERDLQTIPVKLRGSYLSDTDSSLLIINNRQIISLKEVHVRMLADSLDIEIDSSLTNHPDETVRILEGVCTLDLTSISGDSVQIDLSCRDTLFHLDAGDLLRKYKKHYLLNHPHGDHQWSVEFLTLHNSHLILSELTNQDLDQLALDTSDIKTDPKDRPLLKPTKKQLRDLLQHPVTRSHSYTRL